MNTKKLYQALVVGGALLLGGCAARTNTAAEPKPTERCEDVCHRTTSGEVFCPDPALVVKGKVQKNCCWLMSVGKHNCCAKMTSPSR